MLRPRINCLTLHTSVGKISSVFLANVCCGDKPSKLYDKTEVGESCTVGCLLTQGGDDNSYFFTGLKYLEYISRIRITNTDQTVIKQ